MIIDQDQKVRRAVAHYWKTRVKQENKQKVSGKSDQGARSAATGGAQMDGFIELFTDEIEKAGIDNKYIFTRKLVELPGFFRPIKKWDLVVVKDNSLIAVIEAKSHVGSFGNNFNNRTEEAMGSALDIWTAFREQAFLKSSNPFLGYFFMLEDCVKSNRPVKVREPHFKIFSEFQGASYSKRYELFCRKLVLERHYSAVSFIISPRDGGLNGNYKTPADDLSIERFIRCLTAHVASYK